ncbi:hypothetical protein VPH35_115857 [Triticum aestivum]|uniref:GRF-type domain-containing protein n=1 Tax=Aegilops tauschii TaxID=37682 RepID=M8CN87_AEGTA
MSSSSSRATSRMQSPARVEMPIFVCPRCRAGVDRSVSHTSKNQNRPFYVCSENGVKCFFLWVDALAKTLMNELQEEHEDWLPMLPRTVVAAARALEEETEGEARIDRKLAIELRMLKKKVLVIALGVMLKLYGKA